MRSAGFLETVACRLGWLGSRWCSTLLGSCSLGTAKAVGNLSGMEATGKKWKNNVRTFKIKINVRTFWRLVFKKSDSCEFKLIFDSHVDFQWTRNFLMPFACCKVHTNKLKSQNLRKSAMIKGASLADFYFVVNTRFFHYKTVSQHEFNTSSQSKLIFSSFNTFIPHPLKWSKRLLSPFSPTTLPKLTPVESTALKTRTLNW